MSFKFSIPGRPPAKSNSYRIVRIGNFSRLAPTPEVKAYEEKVAKLSEKQRDLLGGKPLIDAPNEVELILTWHRADRRRKDLDNIAKAIKDGMTTGGIWKDDSQVTTLLLHSIQDAASVETEWVDVYVREILSENYSSPKARKKTKKQNESDISNVQAAPSTSDLATIDEKSGTIPSSKNQSASNAGGEKKRTEPIKSSRRKNSLKAVEEPLSSSLSTLGGKDELRTRFAR